MTEISESVFNPEANIEKLVEIATDVKVYGKFPPNTHIRGNLIKQSSGDFTTVNLDTNQGVYEVLEKPEQFKLPFMDWERKPQNENLAFVDTKVIKDKSGNKFARILVIGVEQPNSSIRDLRMETDAIVVKFQFDIPRNESSLFVDLFGKDKVNAAKNLELLLNQMYKGLFTDKDHPDKGIIMKPIEKVMFVSDSLVASREKMTFIQNDPRLVFPPQE